MAGDVDSGGGISALTFGTGASGLAPATISYGSINLNPLMTAIQSRLRNAQNARENELALQQMALREKIAQSEMQLKREQFEAEGPLRAAQTENYRALADYHNRMGMAQSDAITKEWQYKRSLVPQLSEYSDALEELGKQYEIGSDDWWTARGPIDQEFSEIRATPTGMQMSNAYDQRGTRASAAIAQGQLRTSQSLNDFAARYQIPMTAISQLQEAVDSPTKFQASAGGLTNDVWGKNPDGSRYAYFPKDEKMAAQPASLAVVNAMSPEDKAANYRAVTIQAPQVESIVAASRALSGPLRGNGVAPTWAYSLRGGQPRQRRTVTRDANGNLVVQPATP
jgi:hypothetical protein